MVTMDVEIGGDEVVLTEEPPPNEMKHRESKTTLQNRSSTLPLYHCRSLSHSLTHWKVDQLLPSSLLSSRALQSKQCTPHSDQISALHC
ncbi:hypothetical protein ACFX13_028670 [Malus domestica]